MPVPIILRKLEKKRHWDPAPWVGCQDMQADVMKCLSTKNNQLSVYLLNEPHTQIERVVAALAASRDFLVPLDLAVVPIDILKECSIQSDDVQGETPDSEVNGWHRNLVELTVTKITRLIFAIRSKGEIKRYPEKKVEQAIKYSLEAESFTVDRIRSRELIQSLKRRNVISSP